jgi:hypothetical protein
MNYFVAFTVIFLINFNIFTLFNIILSNLKIKKIKFNLIRNVEIKNATSNKYWRY